MSIEDHLAEKQIEIEYCCEKCQENHVVKLNSTLFETTSFPVLYFHMHGDPQFIALLNIDQTKQITNIEYPDVVGFNPNRLQNLIDQTLSNTLKRIPLNQIYAFQLEKNNLIQKMYNRSYSPFKSSLEEFLRQMGRIRTILSVNDEAQEFFVKYPDFWFGGMYLLEYSFFMVVSTQVDIDHLKYQMMSMFEFFSRTIE